MTNETERALYDAWRESNLGYVRPFNKYEWSAWQARARLAEQPAPVAVVPDLTELREYHARAARELEHYADDSGLRESDVKHYRKRAEFHRRQVKLLDSLGSTE